MPLALSITNIQETAQGICVSGNLAASGSYTTAVGGDTVDFTKTTQDAAFLGTAAFLNSSQPPVSLDIWDASGNLANGFFPVLGTTAANCKLKITSAFNTELGTGAYPAAIATTGKLEFSAIFPKNI